MAQGFQLRFQRKPGLSTTLKTNASDSLRSLDSPWTSGARGETISKTRTGSNRDRRLQLESVACETPGQQLTPSPSPAQSTTTQLDIGDTVDCLLPLIGESACPAPWFSVVEELRRPSPRFANAFIASAAGISIPVLFVVSAADVWFAISGPGSLPTGQVLPRPEFGGGVSVNTT
ncbi:hypothetical protein PG985_006047 [Apiospora marii]|uniref:uncharacterized protein n=1 Tax=Apiospora marii TaxID=335849 RepID=UPI00312F266E